MVMITTHSKWHLLTIHISEQSKKNHGSLELMKFNWQAHSSEHASVADTTLFLPL